MPLKPPPRQFSADVIRASDSAWYRSTWKFMAPTKPSPQGYRDKANASLWPAPPTTRFVTNRALCAKAGSGIAPRLNLAVGRRFINKRKIFRSVLVLRPGKRDFSIVFVIYVCEGCVCASFWQPRSLPLSRMVCGWISPFTHTNGRLLFAQWKGMKKGIRNRISFFWYVLFSLLSNLWF